MESTQPMESPKEGRNEIHLVGCPVGHVLAGHDCWCEPIIRGWKTTADKKRAFVIEHHDDGPHHHLTILNERISRKDWITETLNEVVQKG